MKKKTGVSRRDFMRGAAVAGAAFGGCIFPGATARGQGKTLKAGLVGCGSRGRGAMLNHVEAAKALGINVQFVALADAFEKDHKGDPVLPVAVDSLKKKAGQDVPKNQQFTGFDAYKKLLQADIDIVLLCTPPVFRPLQFAAAIAAGKHVFMEKPVAVDPPGARSIVAVGEKAKAKGLSIVAGTQRRHDYKYLQVKKLIDDGAIGQIRGGCVYWCGTQLWNRPRQPGWSDREYMVRNWVNFVEMSADHIVEQHVHNIDVANWFIGTPPFLAAAVGGRARRKTGNQYDFFSVDYTYKVGAGGREKIHVHSMSRQVNGSWGREAEELVGEQGYVISTRLRRYDKKKPTPPDIKGHISAYVQEHIDLLKSITAGGKDPINEAHEVAEATLSGIMGRISAYTGQAVRYSDVAEEDGTYGKLTLKPSAADLEAGDVKAPPDDVIAIPGKD